MVYLDLETLIKYGNLALIANDYDIHAGLCTTHFPSHIRLAQAISEVYITQSTFNDANFRNFPIFLLARTTNFIPLPETGSARKVTPKIARNEMRLSTNMRELE